MILNTLMGSIETKGGYVFKKGPGEVGAKPAQKLTEQKFPKIKVGRFDKVGTPDRISSVFPADGNKCAERWWFA